MDIIYIVLFFVFGLVFGSFYNVVGLRICKGENICFPSSHCTKCGHVLSAYELVPIFSYIFLKGKCKNCKEKISIMYPLMELFTAVLFSLSYYVFGFSFELVFSLFVCSLFIIVVVTDLNYYIIPDSIVIVFGIFVLLYNLITKGIVDMCIYTLYGAIVFLFMFSLMKLGNFLFKEESLGGGDIKLMAVLGMTMAPLVSFLSLAFAAFLALPGSLFLLLKDKDKVIPFGPFIVAGCIIVMFMGIDTHDIIDFLVKRY